jgi:hypothetical protein
MPAAWGLSDMALNGAATSKHHDRYLRELPRRDAKARLVGGPSFSPQLPGAVTETDEGRLLVGLGLRRSCNCGRGVHDYLAPRGRLRRSGACREGERRCRCADRGEREHKPFQGGLLEEIAGQTDANRPPDAVQAPPHDSVRRRRNALGKGRRYFSPCGAEVAPSLRQTLAQHDARAMAATPALDDQRACRQASGSDSLPPGEAKARCVARETLGRRPFRSCGAGPAIRSQPRQGVSHAHRGSDSNWELRDGSWRSARRAERARAGLSPCWCG